MKNDERREGQSVEHPWRWNSIRPPRRVSQNEGGTAVVTPVHVTADGRIKVGQR